MTTADKKDSSSLPIDLSIERRKVRRRPILATFAIFIVIPKKGLHRLTVHDISEEGMGFDLDIEGESFPDFPIAEKESIELRFYLNPSLFIPLVVQVARITEVRHVRHIGAEFKDKSLKNYKAFLSILNLIDGLSDLLQTEPS